MVDYHLQQHLLFQQEKILRSCTPSKFVSDFHLPPPSEDVVNLLRNWLLLEETSYDQDWLQSQHQHMFSLLNLDQLHIYNKVLSAHRNKKQILIFVYHHGGTGKAFLWTTLLSYFRSIGKIVLVVTAYRIASLLLPSSRTDHSSFKIPSNLSEKTSCDIKKRTLLADLLKQTSIIVFDEVPMSDWCCFECLDHSLRDNLECDMDEFGSMSILLGSDIRQTLPVCPKSTKLQIIASKLPNSYFWPYFQVYKLKYNMRLIEDENNSTCTFKTSAFASWLLDIRDWILGTPDATDSASKYQVDSDSRLTFDTSGRKLFARCNKFCVWRWHSFKCISCLPIHQSYF